MFHKALFETIKEDVKILITCRKRTDRCHRGEKGGSGRQEPVTLEELAF
jgi:hypothetical protein